MLLAGLLACFFLDDGVARDAVAKMSRLPFAARCHDNIA
jgi:hypothetical protein